MSRLDDAISDVAYILDVLMAYRNIVERSYRMDATARTVQEKGEM